MKPRRIGRSTPKPPYQPFRTKMCSTWESSTKRVTHWPFLRLVPFSKNISHSIYSKVIFLGIEDFFPNQITRATFFKKPTFETFDKVIERGFSWLQQNPLKRFINAQSIDIKMKSRMLFDCVLEHTALLCLRCRLITLLKSILLCCHQPVQ